MLTDGQGNTIGDDWKAECRKLAEDIVRKYVPQRKVEHDITVDGIAHEIYQRFFACTGTVSALASDPNPTVSAVTVVMPSTPIAMGDQEWDGT